MRGGTVELPPPPRPSAAPHPTARRVPDRLATAPAATQARRSFARVDDGHRGRCTLFADQFDRVGSHIDARAHHVDLGLGRSRQHVLCSLLPTLRLADADPHANEVQAMEMLLERAQAVVSRSPTSDLDSNNSRSKVELIMDHYEP